ncbi:CCA tRNA nucleotidyltransferase [Paenirhodobacter populi]|uniref:CCA tRNA nucleotidyltransferase n=1 Tax=Paenirhodobacter populi TaxID=2306993 RepID=A0A443JD68_9RHOB|nr:CCA tRNA nucleotidyltransferase [Sinirhodobacter populi]RWR18497.1 CCA tRNA nucleotidyltransferase [Sinirhodobacter populi]
MRITGDWIRADHVQQVLGMIEAGGYQALLVGGCVRNDLIGAPVSDMDMATDALPEEVMDLARSAGLRAIGTGIEHGTVTVMAGGKTHEITTFRRDVTTNGRHATVAFSARIEEDAARRDFTVNALYARRDGTVLDPLGTGLTDLALRRVRFVGDPERRIREDYLRILRFFRFTALYGDPERGLDADGLAACAALADGVDSLSRERIGHEMRRLLAAPDPAPVMAAMQASGVLAHVLPGADVSALAPLIHLEGEAAPDFLRRLAVLGAEDAASRLRLSRAEARRLDLLRRAALEGAEAAVLGYRLGARDAGDALLVRAALMGQPPAPDWCARIAFGAAQRFPVRAADLAPHYSGAALGARLRELEDRWIASGFALDRKALLA